MALPPSIDLSGRVALITGGISGIGKGIALELARRGADVAVTYTSESKDEFAHGTVNELNLSRPGARAISIRADLRKVTAHQYIVKETLEKLETDHIDILGTEFFFLLIGSSIADLYMIVHNAGIMHIGATTDETQETFTNIFDTNVRGPYFLTQAVLAHVPKGGRIILISSTSARVASMGSAMALYSATKAALECFARTWAYEVSFRRVRHLNNPTLSQLYQFGPRGITVNGNSLGTFC